MKHTQKNFRQNWHANNYIGYKIVIAAIMAVIFYLIYAANFFSYANLSLQDSFFQKEGTISEDIVVIGVTSDDLEENGMWPWDRTAWANVLEAINSDPETQPAVIGMTIPFYGSSQPVSDDLLEAQVTKDNVILSCSAEFKTSVATTNNGFYSETTLQVDSITYPYVYPNENLTLAHSNILFDNDGVLRNGLLQLETEQGSVIGSMAYETFKKYNDYYETETDFSPALDENGFWYVDYTATSGAYFSYSITDILNGNYNQEALAGKIVLIGVYDQTLMDYFRPSINHSETMYGIEFIANCVNAMIEDTEISYVSPSFEIITLVISTFIITFLALYMKFHAATILVIAYSLFGSILITVAYERGTLYPPFFFLFGLLICYIIAVGFNYWFEWYTKKHVTNIFKQYVDPKVMDTLIQSTQENLHTVGSTSDIAVLFVDLRGFTTISENLDAETVVNILNEFLSLADECIKKYDGTLDKFIGDCAMAFWGAPHESEDPIYLASRAAREMVRRSSELTGKIYTKYNIRVSFGVGIHYGTAVVGNVGSNSRLDYTAIGDTVNTAARLESIAPPHTIYVSEVVANGLGNRAHLQKLDDKLPLKGKKDPISIYILHDID